MTTNENTIELLPTGLNVKDTTGHTWTLGSVIGFGGFGSVYEAIVNGNISHKHVIKVEDKSSGGLFCEINFYNRVMRNTNYINEWKKQKCVSYLGIPYFYGFGVVSYNGKDYRFLVTERLGSDMEKNLQNKKVTLNGIKTLATNLLTILEFIHDSGFSHGDVKASNVLLGLYDNKIYLIDYGLSAKFCNADKEHKKYVENPKNRHQGTLFYTSIDAHKGVTVSRRGDLETLGYCLLKWYSGKLPWEMFENNPSMVQRYKEVFIKRIQSSNDENIITKFIKTVTSLKYDENPDYLALKRMFV